MNEQIDFIRSKCIEANPDIKRLEFGCRIRRVDTNRTEVIKELYYTTNGSDVHYLASHMKFWGRIGPHWDEKNDYIKPMFRDEWWEILGRDIRLSDVLLAWRKAKEPSTWWNPYELMGIASGWNLLKDRLEDQSPETIEFIYNLLK